VGWSSIKALSIWIVSIGLTTEACSQTVELRSFNLSILTGAERERFLATHNAARREVEVDPVDWSDELSNYAMASLAKQKDALIDAAKEVWTKGEAVLPRHRAENSYGENVAGWLGTRQYAADWAVDLWWREKAEFDKLNAIAPYRVGDEKRLSELDSEKDKQPIIVGHYTAIVWRATRHIGAAKLAFELADDQGNHRSYMAIICNYSPPGNRHGERPF
jgi:pathogenesis-related protein 1